MEGCELLDSCVFFNIQMANMPSTAEAIKAKYCRGDSSKCARFVAWKTMGKVPPDLLPNQLDDL